MRAVALVVFVLSSTAIPAQEAGIRREAAALRSADLDPAGLAEWVAGTIRPVVHQGRTLGPADVMWTADRGAPAWHGVPAFGAGPEPGLRHLRLAFTRPLALGSVVVAGGATVAVLRPGLPPPGDPGDDAQWVEAVRAGNPLLWALPPGTVTAALRLSHRAEATDRTYAGQVSGIWCAADRAMDRAGEARWSASAGVERLGTLHDGVPHAWQSWESWDERFPPRPVAEAPPWLVLAWPSPRSIRRLLLCDLGAGSLAVDRYTGGDPAQARGDGPGWEEVGRVDGLRSGYPLRLPVTALALPDAPPTAALRLRLLSSPVEPHPHLATATRNGRRAWLSEVLALEDLGAGPAVASAPPPAPHPPIPVPVRLDRPGWVTVVIEDQAGRRIRNLVADQRCEAGETVLWWDGLDDLGRDRDAARHGLYHVPGTLVAPGAYRVRGLRRGPVALRHRDALYTAGDPPWYTADGTGGWLANHTPPACVLAVPADRAPGGRELVYLGSQISEGTHGLAWVEPEDGRKRGGTVWVGGTWTGAECLALDRGAKADPDLVLVAGAWFEGELRLTALSRDQRFRSLAKRGTKADGGRERLAGLALQDGLLVVSQPAQDRLLLLDARDGAERGTVAVPAPGGVAFDGQGRLLAVSGRQVLRFAPGLPTGAPVVLVDGLEDPGALAWDAAWGVLVAERGARHQVLVFDDAGRPAGVIGRPGRPGPGAYDPLRLNHPAGLGVDGAGRLWVAEAHEQPRRVSRWRRDGTLDRAWYGPAEYGGGGEIDGERFRYRGMAFLRGRDGFQAPERVFWDLADPRQPRGHQADGVPQTPVRLDGRTYLHNAFASNPTGGSLLATIWIERDGRAEPCAVVGDARRWPRLERADLRGCWPAGAVPGERGAGGPVRVRWSDLDGDGDPSPGELVLEPGQAGGITVMPDLAVVATRWGGDGVRIAPAGWTPCGAPRYGDATAQVLVAGVQAPVSTGGDQLLADPSGWTVGTAIPRPFAAESLAGSFRGEPRWSYPSPWPGLHASHEAPVADQSGRLLGTTRLLGGLITPRGGQAGPLWAVNGNFGPAWLFTLDGLLVAQLFEDVRTGKPWSMPRAVPGQDLSGCSPSDENFWPSIAQGADGRVWMVSGRPGSLIEIEGLDDVQRLPECTLEITPAHLDAVRAWTGAVDAHRRAQEGPRILRLGRPAGAPRVDGMLDDWAGADWAVIDRRGTKAWFNSDARPYDVQAALAVADGRLFAAWRTGDPGLLRNPGGTAHALFTTGGALDLMLGADAGADPARTLPAAGDLRLVVAEVAGRTRAVLYRAVVPGTPPGERIPFASPWRSVAFDRVDEVTEAIRLAGRDGDWELSIPLDVLGWDPDRGPVRGDLGILRGNGIRTVQRVYWANRGTGITADVPSEAELLPARWGIFLPR